MLVCDAGRIDFRMVATVFTAVLLAAACGEEPVEPDETPPDLSGSYTLVSFTSTFTAGDTLTPPAADGSFTLVQTSVLEQEAMGTLDLFIMFPDESGPGTTLENEGVYTNRFDGSWEQEFSTGFQALGTYTLQNNILTVVVTEPALAVSTTVWRRQ